MIEKIENIVLSNCKDLNILGRYNIKFHLSSVEFDGVEYKYLANGGCRKVFISPCKQFVLKIPMCRDGRNEKDLKRCLDMFNELDQACCLPVEVQHNFYEAKCYQNAPEEYRKFMAKTELLPNGWIKQEFVKVERISWSTSLIEIGINSKNDYVIFDFDMMFRDIFSYCEPDTGFDYKNLEKTINEITEDRR